MHKTVCVADKCSCVKLSSVNCPLTDIRTLNNNTLPSSQQTLFPVGRRGHTAVIYGNSMYIYGGYVDMKGSSSELWQLSFGKFDELRFFSVYFDLLLMRQPSAAFDMNVNEDVFKNLSKTFVFASANLLCLNIIACRPMHPSFNRQIPSPCLCHLITVAALSLLVIV